MLGGCGHCDVCAALDGANEEPEAHWADGDDAATVRKALAAVARAKGRAGLSAVTEMLCGVRSERTERFGFTALSTFGLLSTRPVPWVTSLLRGLVAAGWIDLTTTDHPVPLVTTSGWTVMKTEGAVRFRLPPPVAPGKPSRGRKRARRTDDYAGGASASGDPVFERLRAYRAKAAKARHVPPYVVALDRTLTELAAKRPTRIEDLADIYGLGPARIESYGPGLLRAIAADGGG